MDVGSSRAESSSDGAPKTDNSASSQITYTKTKGHATTKGQDYEVTFIALLLLRLKSSEVVSEFHLASNVDGAGALDDVVVKYKTRDRPSVWKTCFVQLKHKEAASFGVKSCLGSGDFSILKYFRSYIEIKQLLRRQSAGLFEGCTIESCSLVLYTNAKTFPDLTARTTGGARSVGQRDVDELLKSNRDNELIFSFDENEKCDEEILASLVKDKDVQQVQEVRDFVDAYTVFSGQPSVKQMEELVETELLRATSLLKPDIEHLRKCYVDAIGKWWDKCKTTLTKDVDVLERILNDLKITALSSHVVKHFTFESIQFHNVHLFDAHTLDKCPLLHLSPVSKCMKLCCTKLVQSLQKVKGGYIILGLDSLLDDAHAVMSTWGRCKSNRLVIVCEASTGEQQVLCTALRQHVEKHGSTQKIIVVSAQHDAFTLNLKKTLAVECCEVQDSFRLSQLKAKFQRRIENRDVSFQGATMKMGELLKGGVDFVSGVLLLDDDLIQRILNTEPVSFGSVLDDTISYYIPRTLERQDCIDKNILRATSCDDRFIVHNITKQELQKLVPERAEAGNVGDSSGGSCRFLAKGSGSTANIGKALERKGNVHELGMQPDGNLRWSSTKGSMAGIYEFIIQENPTSYNPSTALDLKGRVILISAEAGMGKSTFLIHLASETKKSDPSYWVIRVDLKDHLDKLHQFKGDAVRFLSSAVGMSESVDTESSLFRFMMEKGKCVVLCDGFDEIAPDYTDKGLELLTGLLETKASKIFITTRHALKNKLEKHLGTLTFTLRKFDADDQRMFFLKFWTRDESTANTQDQLEELIRKLVELIACSLNDITNEFMGTPLIALMLAEIYDGYFKDHKTTEALPTRLNIIKMFEQVVDKKFHIYLHRLFGDMKNIGHAKNKLLKYFFKDHMRASLMLLLDSRIDGLHNGTKIRVKQDEFLNEMNAYDYKAGIITKVLNAKPIFLHRTYAEYFAALWFSRNYDKNQDFLRKYLFSDEFTMIRRLFDLMLASQSELLTALVNQDVKTVTSLLTQGEEDVNTTDQGGRSALHLGAVVMRAFAVYRHPNILTQTYVAMLLKASKSVVEHLLEHGAVGYGVDKVLGWNALEYAIHTQSWQAFEEFHAHLSFIKEFGPTPDSRYVANRETPRQIMASGDYDCTLLPTLCRSGFKDYVELVISSLEEDLKLITRITSQSPTESARPTRPECASDAVAKYINVLDPRGQTALHYATETSIDTAGCITALVSKGGDVWARNNIGRTSLHTLCQSKHCNVDTIGALTSGLEGSVVAKYVNTKDSCGNCALHIAASWSGSPEVIELLISKGGDVWALNDYGATPLHALVDSPNWNLDCCNALIANLDGKDVAKYMNTKNYLGASFLHLACTRDEHEIIQVLMANGADLWAVDNEERTPLHTLCASEHDDVDCAVALVANLDENAATDYVNRKDSAGESGLHLAARMGHHNVIELLISKGGDIWALNNEGQTPLHVNCGSYYIDVNVAMHLICAAGLDGNGMEYMNIKDAAGRTAMDLALETPSRHTDVTQQVDAMKVLFKTARDFLPML